MGEPVMTSPAEKMVLLMGIFYFINLIFASKK
jgi:hypothetical protein